MIFLKLTDGLGNQMFQYAFARYLQQVYGEKIYLDVTKLGKRHVRSYGLHHFVLNEDVVIPSMFIQYLSRFYTKLIRLFFNRIVGWSTTTEEGFRKFISVGYYTTNGFYQYFSFKRSVLPVKFVRGYFQNPFYFSEIGEIIRSEFKLKKLPRTPELEAMAKELQSVNSVCLHIRRGDYVKIPKFKVCTESYYQEGLNFIRQQQKDAVAYVFSNTPKDIQWIRENYHFDGEVRYVDMGNSEIDDLYLMMHCHHFVISNSTYSWWAAYLSEQSDKIVVAPKPWVNDEDPQDGIYCKEWEIIEARKY